METIIQGTISALGYLEDGVYYPEPDCYETIRDLIRFLRNDSSDLMARRICGERNIVDNDLIPILKRDCDNEKMFDITLRLLANLVQPALVSLMGKQPEDKEQWQLFWELEENLRRSKMAFADIEFFKTLKKKLVVYFLETEWDDRLEETRLVMERIVVLIRYVLAISTGHRDDKRTAVESNSHDRVISSFLDSGIQEVLLHVAAQSKERDFHLSILEIIAYIVKEHNPADLVSAVSGRSAEEKAKSEAELRQLYENEVAKTAAMKRKLLGARHSRFAGSYVVKGLSAVNKDNDIVVHKAVADVSKVSFLEERKKKRTIAKNRRPFEADQKTHVSSVEVRLKLKLFVESVLASAFNRMMKSSKSLAFEGRRSVGQRNADIHYFLVMRFFSEYCRMARMSTSVISECIGVEAFHHCQNQLTSALENAHLQRKEGKIHGMRAQYALSAYKELILVHQYMLDRGSNEEKESSHATCQHILIVEEYRELGCSVMRQFMPGALSKTFLRDLVLSSHYYFRMLEKSVKSGEMQTIKKRVKKRKNRKPNGAHKRGNEAVTRDPVDALNQDELDDVWADISEELSDVVVGHLEPSDDQIPINNLLDVNDEDHQRFAMLYVQRALRSRRVADAVGIYRAAREIWLSEGVFGRLSMPVEEEFVELREVFFAELDEVAKSLVTAQTLSNERFAASSSGMMDGDEDEDESAEEDEPDYETKEIPFDFTEYIVKFARTEVLKWYVFLLNDYETNSVELNKALVKMMHRVTFDLNMPSRLYQISLFRIFDKLNARFSLLGKDEMKKSPLSELFTFGFHLLKKFMANYAAIGDKLAPELLFWKGPKECYEIENGYGSYTAREEESKVTWTEDLETELRSLYNEYRDMDERPEGMDVLDFVEHNLSRPRTRKQIQKKMKELALDTMGAKSNKGSVQDRTFPNIELKRLAEQFSEKEGYEQDDLVNFVRDAMSSSGKGDFTRQKIIKQLTYLGIPYEKKAKSSGVSKSKSKWSPELLIELENLKAQYDDMDSDDHALISLADYVARRLSQPRPKHQVEDRLRELGVNIPKTKSAPKRSQRANSFTVSDDEDENNLVDEAANSDVGSLDSDVADSDGDDNQKDEIGDLVDSDAEDGDMTARQPRFRSKTTTPTATQEMMSLSVDNISSTSGKTKVRKAALDSDDDDIMSIDEAHSVLNEIPIEPATSTLTQVDKDNDPLSTTTFLAKKRKRVIDSDDEENEDPVSSEAVPVLPVKSPVHTSPSRATKKKRVVVSDSEDDKVLVPFLVSGVVLLTCGSKKAASNSEGPETPAGKKGKKKKKKKGQKNPEFVATGHIEDTVHFSLHDERDHSISGTGSGMNTAFGQDAPVDPGKHSEQKVAKPKSPKKAKVPSKSAESARPPCTPKTKVENTKTIPTVGTTRKNVDATQQSESAEPIERKDEELKPSADSAAEIIEKKDDQSNLSKPSTDSGTSTEKTEKQDGQSKLSMPSTVSVTEQTEKQDDQSKLLKSSADSVTEKPDDHSKLAPPSPDVVENTQEDTAKASAEPTQDEKTDSVQDKPTMEKHIDVAPTRVALGTNNRIVIGCVDGSIRMATFDLEKEKLDFGWQFDMLDSVRDVIFDHDETALYSVNRNRAVCSFDVETGVRTRCIRKGTKGRPNTICLMPPTSLRNQQFATGDDGGQVITWDFRTPDPRVNTWDKQDEDINAVAMDSLHNLLAASSDGTLAAYDVRKNKLRMKSEVLHSELLSICVTDRYVYCGGLDGYIEVFNPGEYGNILERIESGYDMGVHQIAQLRTGLLMTTSDCSSKMRLLNVMPTKRLGAPCSHGENNEGVDQISISPDRSTLVSISGMANSIKFWPLQELINEIPILHANNMAKLKRKPAVTEGFFDDMLEKKKKTDCSDDDEDSDESDDSIEYDSDVSVSKIGKAEDSDDDDEDEEDDGEEEGDDDDDEDSD